MKRTATANAATTENDNDDLILLKREYKRCKRAYKNDKSNDELKKAKSSAKKAWEEAKQANATPETKNETCSDDSKEHAQIVVSDDGESESSSNKAGNDDNNTTASSSTPSSASNTNIQILEDAYQKALSAFKSNKLDKDLRRAKTAARRALDDALLAASTDGAQQLVCHDCSKKFLFTKDDQKKHEEKKWNKEPKRCGVCAAVRRSRMALSLNKRDKLDGQKRNMCYAFQRGECPHGEHCKFSHNPQHGGKRSNKNDDGATEDKKEKGEEEDKDTIDETEIKDRKERSMRKKGKGWRNK
mmetsp:Transcript_21931/g.46292  ORF Transcript_21931/g.46292 Transcript_21931/m.46292 type:complete len:300 (+) Transcript_21931:130-1029(+)|eukprot:CAMPEP_0183711474 /NCGR_PEP_ID=MMETSP0737-20130205/6969_1 /TAXON_ID=385413 /ORGANISM="Thalassiosira miniscula, Strain CCMP1093" /LENGTH=299 /DNA_ID=CAMNT_0025939991 /DNA_START=54 /DNA_END=953 /DNA_ORIENTATION=+